MSAWKSSATARLTSRLIRWSKLRKQVAHTFFWIFRTDVPQPWAGTLTQAVLRRDQGGGKRRANFASGISGKRDCLDRTQKHNPAHQRRTAGQLGEFAQELALAVRNDLHTEMVVLGHGE